jgi:dihydropteroate synthase
MPPWILRDRPYHWGQKTYLMGVLNVTPDSFSDGGRFDTVAAAVAQARQMVADGADWLDIGGESTRPNAEPVALAEELARVIPVVTALRQNSQFDTVPLSIDTTKAAVAQLAIEAGADLINDISGAVRDHQMLKTVAALDVPIILMHSRGTPQTMQRLTDYVWVVFWWFLPTRNPLPALLASSTLALTPALALPRQCRKIWPCCTISMR